MDQVKFAEDRKFFFEVIWSALAYFMVFLVVPKQTRKQELHIDMDIT